MSVEQQKDIEINLKRLRRYLHLGFQDLEINRKPTDFENLSCLIELINNKNGKQAVDVILKISKEGNLKNREFILTALALCAKCNDLDTKKSAYSKLKEICLSAADLFRFVQKCEALAKSFAISNALGQSKNSKNKSDAENSSKVDEIKLERSPTTGEIKNSENQVPNAPSVSEIPQNDLLTKRKTSADISSRRFGQNSVSNEKVVEIINTERLSSANLLKKMDQLKISREKTRVSSAGLVNREKKEENVVSLPRISSAKVNNTKELQTQNTLSIKQNEKTPSRVSSAQKVPPLTGLEKNSQRVPSASKTLQLKSPETGETNKIVAESHEKPNGQQEKSESSKSQDLLNNSTMISVNTRTGWGRAHKRAISDWYTSKSSMELVKMFTRQPRRYNWSHRDIIKLAHPKSDSVVFHMLVKYVLEGFNEVKKFYLETVNKTEFEYIIDNESKKKLKKSLKNQTDAKENKNEKPVNEKIKKVKKFLYKLTPEIHQELKTLYEYLLAYDTYKNVDDETKAIELMKSYHFDFVPRLLSKSNSVWLALIESDTFSLESLIKSLARLSLNHILIPNPNKQENAIEKSICDKIRKEDLVRSSGLHPVFLFKAAKCYDRGSKYGHVRWRSNKRVKSALDDAFVIGFDNLNKINNRVCYSLNIWVHNTRAGVHKNTIINPVQTSAIMTLCALKNSPNSKVYFIGRKIELLTADDVNFKDFESFMVSLWSKNVGIRNMSHLISESAKNSESFDSFVVYTNLEADQISELKKQLDEYRVKMNLPNSKFVFVSMIKTKITVAFENDLNMLDFVGFTNETPQILDNYLNDLF